MGLISIIVPVVSRVNRLVLQTKQLERLASEVASHDFELIFVDDGSHTEPLKVLKETADKDKRYRVITLTRDFGQTAAFLAGITYASGDCAGFFSGRSIDPCKIFSELIRHWESGSKVVFGKWEGDSPYSAEKGGTFLRELSITRRLFPNRIFFQDINSMLIDKEVMYILSQITDPYSDMVEIIAWTGFTPRLVEYSFQTKDDGSKRIGFQDHSISLKYSEGIYSPKTLKTSFSVGLFLAALGGLTTAGFIIVQDYYHTFIPDWWMLTSVIIFIFGVQLGLMGLFGEQLFRSLEKLRSRPVFIVDSIINPPKSSSAEGREKLEKMILSLWSIRKQKIAYASSIAPTEEEE
jgi:glycosyltransferase involved in cell wall biosynthesis